MLSVALLLICLVGSCWGDIMDPDPLHGYCAVGCNDNGTNSPTGQNPPTNFGFTVTPGPAGGDLVLDILVPNNEAHLASYGIIGTLPGTATLFNSTAWTSGTLETYLGDTGASPSSPLGAYLPSTQALDPGATGFLVFQVDLGPVTLNGQANPNVSPLENLANPVGLPLASYMVGFFNEGTVGNPNWIATANSGAIFETSNGNGSGSGGGGPLPSVPEPASVALFGTLALLAAKGFARKSRAN